MGLRGPIGCLVRHSLPPNSVQPVEKEFLVIKPYEPFLWTACRRRENSTSIKHGVGEFRLKKRRKSTWKRYGFVRRARGVPGYVVEAVLRSPALRNQNR